VKVLITGGTGQLGHALLQTCPAGCDPITPHRHALNLSDLASLQQALSDIAPDALINCAAYTAVDKAEEENDLAEQVNAHAVRVMAAYSQEHAIPMIQVSTDFVFDGKQSAPYSVTDTPNPLGEYGRSKLMGELAAREAYPDVYIVRSSWIYSEHGNNFVKIMLRLARKGQALKVVIDQFGSPTYARNLATFIWLVLDQRPAQKLLHCSDEGKISWYEFAVAIFAEAQSAGLLTMLPDISACSSDEYQAPAPRPAYSALECKPCFAALGLDQTDWRIALRDMLAHLD
jgi:dTDP-4-dehydrorhamnose reductase